MAIETPFRRQLLGAIVCRTLVSLYPVSLVIGHSGGLDTTGCHHRRKAGDYHCHQAHPPSSFMKKWMAVVAMLWLTGVLAADVFAGSVRGYYRKDGTYVQPYQRTNPDGDPSNNYTQVD